MAVTRAKSTPAKRYQIHPFAGGIEPGSGAVGTPVPSCAKVMTDMNPHAMEATIIRIEVRFSMAENKFTMDLGIDIAPKDMSEWGLGKARKVVVYLP